MEQPGIEPIKNGWAALGNGWAVHGKTQEEALETINPERLWPVSSRPVHFAQRGVTASGVGLTTTN